MIYGYAIQYDAPRAKGADTVYREKVRSWPPVETLAIIADRYAKGETIAALAREFDVSEPTVWRALKAAA